MKRLLVAALAVLCAASVGACGRHHDEPTPFVADILSSQTLDGDITLDNGFLQPPVIATTFGNVQAGFDPGAPPAIPEAETRAFLVFDLSPVPSTASIGFASLTVFVTRVNALGTGLTAFPFFLDLLDTRPGGTPPPLVSSDYNAALLVDRSFAFLLADAGNFVEIDVTPLMKQAQATGQPFFEVRLTPALVETGIVTIDDGPAARAPILRVDYF